MVVGASAAVVNPSIHPNTMARASGLLRLLGAEGSLRSLGLNSRQLIQMFRPTPQGFSLLLILIVKIAPSINPLELLIGHLASDSGVSGYPC
jgi:hypothetical protein